MGEIHQAGSDGRFTRLERERTDWLKLGFGILCVIFFTRGLMEIVSGRNNHEGVLELLDLAASLVLAIAMVIRAPAGRRIAHIVEIIIPGLFLSICGSVLLPVFLSARVATDQARCNQNIKALLLRNILYSSDYDDRNAPTSLWRTLGSKYAGTGTPDSELRCGSSTAPYTYALNSSVGGFQIPDMVDIANTVEIFEADSPFQNAAGGKEMLLFRHSDHPLVGFADGHAGWSPAAKLRWKPGQ
jgi:hypothetical protein